MTGGSASTSVSACLTGKQEGDVVLTCPTRALRTVRTVRKTVSRALPKNATVHCRLAVDLALDLSNESGKSAWNAVMPNMQDFEAGMPLTWSSQLQALLPSAARTLLANQQAKYDRDWEMVSVAFSPMSRPSVSEEHFRHAWLLVNTRTFYHSTPKTEALNLPRDEYMALQPIADLFNHADEAGCTMTFDSKGFMATVTRPYDKGDEMFVSYGTHSNDFLLVEYGFILHASQNKWDEINIDEAILPLLSREQKDLLEEVGFLGGYVLDMSTLCHRTQVALRLLVMKPNQWRRFVDGRGNQEAMQAEVDALACKMLMNYLAVVKARLEDLRELMEGSPDQRALLIRRWEQILEIIKIATTRLVSNL
jgi:hypothetical protein